VAVSRSDKERRKRLTPDVRRQQLIDLGKEVALTEGPDELSVQRVADLAGVSRALVFHYFPTVNDLRVASLGQAARELIATIIAAVEQAEAERRDPFRSGLEAYVDHIYFHSANYMAIIGYAANDIELGELFDSARQAVVELIVESVERPVDALWTSLLRGWVSLVEISVADWLETGQQGRDQLIDILLGVKSDIIGRWKSSVESVPPTS
jgi:AcrR family transcriptional regulator